MSARLPRTVFALLLGISLAMFLTPGDDVPQGGPNDKVTHLMVFAALAVAGRWARVPPLTLGIGLAAYAGLTELLQGVLPIDRHGDVRDLAADVTGILLGLLLSWIAGACLRTARPAARCPSPRPGSARASTPRRRGG